VLTLAREHNVVGRHHPQRAAQGRKKTVARMMKRFRERPAHTSESPVKFPAAISGLDGKTVKIPGRKPRYFQMRRGNTEK